MKPMLKFSSFALKSSLLKPGLKSILGLSLVSIALVVAASSLRLGTATAQTTERPLTIQSDIQEANAKTGVVTARGNVQLNYPARSIQATAAQAQYFSRERRIVLSGDVFVIQDGNTLRGETVTYLVDEGRFVAMPQANQQVESVLLVEDTPDDPTASPTPPFSEPGTTTPVPGPGQN